MIFVIASRFFTLHCCWYLRYSWYAQLCETLVKLRDSQSFMQACIFGAAARISHARLRRQQLAVQRNPAYLPSEGRLSVRAERHLASCPL